MFSILNKVREIRNSFSGSSSSKVEEGAVNAPIDAKGLALSSLRLIGCQPKVADNGDISIYFRGEVFILRHIGGAYVRVWFQAGMLKSSPQIITEAVNKSNYEFGPTVIIEETNGVGNYMIHLRQDIVLHPALPNIDEYLQVVFCDFLKMREAVRKNYQEAMEKQANVRRPIGFTTPVSRTA